MNLKPRLYQEKIFNKAISNNTLVVLPTGLGKTAIAAMLINNRLNNYKKSKVVLLAPTKPLAQQHEESIKKFLPEYKEKIVLFTGSVSPQKRAKLWEENQIIISTPQGFENDLIGRKINLKDVSLVVFDEAHRATGEYSYVFIAKKYVEQSNHQKILALTASPGSNTEKILEICSNLHLEEIEFRTKNDEDVKPYVQDLNNKYITVELTEELKHLKQFLDRCYTSKLNEAKGLGYLTGDVSSYTKTNLLKIMSGLHGNIARGDKSFELMKTISLISESLKVQHALELVETQTVNSALEYLRGLEVQAQTSKVKAVKNLVQDVNFRSALLVAKNLSEKKVYHPKLLKIKELVDLEVGISPKAKIMIFSQYRDSAKEIKSILNNVTSKVFVGQAKKKNTGLSQKEQKQMIEEFKNNEFNCLIATSVGEEGLDIPEVDLVIFYEPVPSAIRTVQRRGRTGRQKEGKVITLITKDTRDEVYRWSAYHKEKRMYSHLKQIKSSLTLFTKKTEEVEESNILIKADYREKGSALLKELLELGIKIDLEKLPIGDYQISDEVVLEFKTIPDFVDSIIDNRLLTQLKDLKSYKKPFLLLQGDEDVYSQRKINANAIRGMISAISINFGIPIIRTQNPKDSAEFLKVIATREQGSDKKYQSHTSKPISDKYLQEYIVSSFPGIGSGLANPLLKEFKTIKKLVNASVEDLKKVELIGDKKAQKIREILDKEYEE